MTSASEDKPDPKKKVFRGAAKVEMWPIDNIVGYEKNSRSHSDAQLIQLEESIKKFGFTNPILVDENKQIIAGHGRWTAAKRMRLKKLPVIMLDYLSEAEKKAYRIADNQIPMNADWYESRLAEELRDLRDNHNFDLSLTGFDDSEIERLLTQTPLGDDTVGDDSVGSLAEKFGISPFSVFNGREGWWQARKAAWIALGIESEVGRGDNLLKMSDTMRQPDKEKREASREIEDGWDGTSIFDPVLCEIALRWFCPPGGKVLDPFAGGSVRGVVAAKLARHYVGVDLRAEQIEANIAQAEKICGDIKPAWACGDSAELENIVGNSDFDFLFSCPPYSDLERYSDDPRDLSTMGYADFIDAYGKIIDKACQKLADNRFAFFVVGDIRNKAGFYRNFVADTIQAFLDAGLHLYNEGILITAVGSLAMRAGKAFENSRKLGKTHQNCLVFIKGDPKEATKAIGDVEFGSFDPGNEFGEQVPVVNNLGGEV